MADISVGDITATLRVNTSQLTQGLQQAQAAFSGFQQQAQRTQQQLSALPFTAIDNAIQQFSRSIQNAGNSQQRYVQAITEAQTAMRQFGVTTTDTGQMIDRFGRQLSRASQESLRQFSTGIREAQGHLNALKQFGIDAGAVSSRGGGIVQQMLGVAGGLGIATTIAGAVSMVKELATESVQLAARLQDLARSFVALEGSVAGAQRTLGMAFSVAQRAGVDFEEVARGLRNLQAGARGTVLTSEQIQRAFEGITLGARALGASTEMTGRALVAWEQILTKGRLSAEELVRQLGNAIPGGLAIAAQAFGVTTARLREMAESGLAPVTAAFIGFGEAMRGIGEGVGPIQGLSATFARLGNETKAWMDALGGFLGETLVPLLNKVLKVSEDIRKTLGIGGPGQGPQARQEPQTLPGRMTDWAARIYPYIPLPGLQGLPVPAPFRPQPPPGPQAPPPTAATTFPVAESRYTEQILRAAQQRQIDPGLLSQLIRAESGFRPFAVSEAGAVGLGQFMLPTARQLQPGITREQLFEPQRNIELAAQYLAQQLDAFKATGDQVRLALTAYHSGPDKVRRLLQEAVRRNLPPTLEGISRIPETEGGLGPQGRAYAGRVLEAPNVRQLTPEQLAQARTRMTEGWAQDIAAAMDRFAGLQRQVEDATASGRNFGGMLNKDIRQEADRVLKTFTDILGAMARFPDLAAQIPPELRQIVEANAQQAAIWREGIMSQERQLDLLKQQVEQLEQAKIAQEAVRIAQEQGQADAESYRRRATAELQQQRLADRPRLAGLDLQQQIREYQQRLQVLQTETDHLGLRLERARAQQMLPGIEAEMSRIQTLLGRPDVSAPEQARRAVVQQAAELERGLMDMLTRLQQNPALVQIAPQILEQWETAFRQIPQFVEEQGRIAFDAMEQQMQQRLSSMGDAIDQIRLKMGVAGLSPLQQALGGITREFAAMEAKLVETYQALDTFWATAEPPQRLEIAQRMNEITDALARFDEARAKALQAKTEEAGGAILTRLRDQLEQLQVPRGGEAFPFEESREQLKLRQQGAQIEMTEEQRAQTEALLEQIQAQRQLNYYLGLYEQFAGSIGNAWTQALTGIADGTRTVAEAFREMARSIMQSLMQIASQEAFKALIKIGFNIAAAAFGSTTTPTGGGSPTLAASIGGGAAMPFQHGGVVNRPTIALLGEAGREYVVPERQMQAMQAAMRPRGSQRETSGEVHVHNHPTREAAEGAASRDRAAGHQAVVNEVMVDLSRGESSRINRMMRTLQR